MCFCTRPHASVFAYLYFCRKVQTGILFLLHSRRLNIFRGISVVVLLLFCTHTIRTFYLSNLWYDACSCSYLFFYLGSYWKIVVHQDELNTLPLFIYCHWLLYSCIANWPKTHEAFHTFYSLSNGSYLNISKFFLLWLLTFHFTISVFFYS